MSSHDPHSLSSNGAGGRTRCLFFDLDGTLMDPALGIIGSVRHALAEIGAPVPDFETLHWVIGPPLRVSFEKLLGSTERVEEVLEHYRARYRGGAMFEATLYEGMVEALRSLSAEYQLLVVTSKPHVMARPILAHFELDRHFASIHGSELDGRFDDKGELIGHVLASERITPSEALMIGDRKFDVLGASRNGVATIGVLWGHGGEAELREAGAAMLCERPADLARLAAEHFGRSSPAGA